MDLSLGGIYSASLKALKKNLLLYLLLFIWGTAQALILLFLLTIGSIIWFAAVAILLTQPDPGSPLLYATAAFFGIFFLVAAILTAATKAAVLTFGAKLRCGEPAGARDFFRGILQFTIPLFIGGLVVGMLTSIPTLAFLFFARINLEGITSEIFTSGWNFSRAIIMIRYLWSMMMVAGVFHLAIFFWIAPWDEMVVLYRLRYPEALLKSLTFVFSGRHFLRVITLVVANLVIAQVMLILTNFNFFTDGLAFSPAYAWFWSILNSPLSLTTSFFNFVLLPFFAFTQLYLLPIPESQKKTIPVPDTTQSTEQVDNSELLELNEPQIREE